MHRKPRHTLLALLIVLMGILNVHIGRTQDGFSVTPQWSFDGERVALVEGMNILIYEVESGAILHRLDSHTDAILSIDWSPVDDRLASAGADQTVKVWDTNNGSLLFTLSGHQAPVSALVWSPDGTEILSWGFDTQPNLFVWDASTGALLARHNSGSIVAAAFSADEKKLALSTSLLISIRTSQILEPIIQSPRVMCCANQMYSLAWSSDSTKIATGSINGLITIWDAETLTPLRRFPANPHYVEDSRDVPDLALSWVRDVSFAVDGSVQAVSGDGTVRQWDTHGNLLEETQIGQLETAAWSPYSTRLAVQISADSSNLTSADVLRIETPFASLQPIDSLNALPDFVAQVESLPEGAIPAACRADLLAVADALR